MSFFTETLRDILGRTGLSQVQLAEASGVNSSVLSRLLTGTREPMADQVAAVCVGLGADANVRAELALAFLRDQAAPILRRAGLDERRLNLRLQNAETSSPPAEEPSWWESAPVGLVIKLEVFGRIALRSPETMAVLDGMTNLLLHPPSEAVSNDAFTSRGRSKKSARNPKKRRP